MSIALFKHESTPHWPLHEQVNAIYSSSVTATGPQFSSTANYGPEWVRKGSSTLNGKQYAKDLGFFDNHYRWNATTGQAYLGDTNPVGDPIGLNFDLDNGIGYTASLDSFIFTDASNNNFCGTGYQISASNDATNWTGLVALDKGSNIQHDTDATCVNNDYYRYYRLLIVTGSAGSGYRGLAGFAAWDSSQYIKNVNLLDPSTTNVTGSFEGGSNTSLTKLTSPQRENYGWYANADIGSLDLSFGDGPKLFRSMLMSGYSNATYYPGSFQVWKSDTGNYNDWTLVASVDHENTQQHVSHTYYTLDFCTPIKTQYLRIVLNEEGDGNTVNLLSYHAWMYELVSVDTPPLPTAVTASAVTNNVFLSWAQNSGSDNRLEDIMYNIQRDDGSGYTHIATLSGSSPSAANTASFGSFVPTVFADLELPDGTYNYKIQSKNQHHLTTSSFVTSTSVTVPATSGGGTSKKIYTTNKGNILINPNDTTLIEL